MRDFTPQYVHRGVLASLAVCALVIWTAGSADPSGEADRRFGIAAFALAGASIIARRAAPATPTRPGHLTLQLTSLLLAGGVGLVGVALALGDGPRDVALLYTLGAAILALRPPSPIPGKA